MFFFSLRACNRPQELALYGEFTLRETLLYFGWINGMTTSEADERIEFLIRLLQLPSVTRFVKSLSGGQQRRMSLAAALIHGNEWNENDGETIFFWSFTFHFEFRHRNAKTMHFTCPCTSTACVYSMHNSIVMKHFLFDYITCRTWTIDFGRADRRCRSNYSK